MKKLALATSLLLGVIWIVIGCTTTVRSTTTSVAFASTESDRPQDMEDEGHPEMDEEFLSMTCYECHQEFTPEVAQGWLESKHGINNVKCLVCHGDLIENFIKIPSTDRCLSCHSEEVASMQNERMNEKTCFSCHTGHTLSPHLHHALGGES